MEMKINLEKLISEKNKRAWTQDHLAEVCGLSLRTIQRIEKTGVASHDTIKALASVFEISIEELVIQDDHDSDIESPIKNNNNDTSALTYFSSWLNGKRLARIGLLFIASFLLILISAYASRDPHMIRLSKIPRTSTFELSSMLSLFTLLPGIVMLAISQNIYKYNKPWSYWLLLLSSIIFLVLNIKIGFFILLAIALLVKWLSRKYA